MKRWRTLWILIYHVRYMINLNSTVIIKVSHEYEALRKA